MKDVATIEITQKEYDTLVDRDFKLSCLEAGGVDNWSGYDWAMEAYRDEEDEE